VFATVGLMNAAVYFVGNKEETSSAGETTGLQFKFVCLNGLLVSSF